MDEVPHDVSGTLLSKRQVDVLRRLNRGESHAEIAERLDTTVEGVRALEEQGRENLATAYRTVRIGESLRADVLVEADAGMTVLDVVRELRSAGDRIGVKLGSTEERLHDELADLLADYRDENVLTADVTLEIEEDGCIDLAESPG
ncbi:MAG: hypothetical protein ABEJ58_05515 [Halodesulfurarchaeum sp.]